MNGNSISTIPHSTKFRVMDNCDLRKHEQSLTPNKKINFPNLQDQLYFSREEELKLRLKPTASQVAPSNSKAKLVSDRKRINSKVVNQKKDEIEPSNTSRLHRAWSFWSFIIYSMIIIRRAVCPWLKRARTSRHFRWALRWNRNC